MDTERWEQKTRERMERQRERMERHRERMERRQERWARGGQGWGGPNATGGMIIGLAIIAVGVLFLLRNAGFLYFDDIWQYWPVVLIVIGISKIANPRCASNVVGGLIIGGIGTVFLLRNLGYIYGDIWTYIWPGVLIAVGLSILVKHLEARDAPPSPPPPPPGTGSSFTPGAGSSFPPGPGSSFAPKPGGPFPQGSAFTATSTSSRANYLRVETAFGGVRQRIESQDFEGGKVSVVFGGAEIDLRGAGTKRAEISIKAEAIFGGIELWVPAHWQTIVRGSGVFGTFEDKTFPAAPGTQANAPRLTITGAAVFGSVIVKN